MRPITLKSFATFLAIAVALGVSACGNKHERIHHAETEGIYVNVDELKYQVQISRQLNPRAIPYDATFVTGVDPAETQLEDGEIWFAVFVRVENESDEPQAPVSDITITDASGEEYTPITLGDENPFAYTTDPIRAGGVAPTGDSVTGELGSIAGLELLFKLKHETLDQRPLEMHYDGAEDEATVVLDV